MLVRGTNPFAAHHLCGVANFYSVVVFETLRYPQGMFLFPTPFNVLSQTAFYSLVGNLSLPAGFLHCMLDFTIYTCFHDFEQMMFVCPAQERISWRPLDTWIDQREWMSFWELWSSVLRFFQLCRICLSANKLWLGTLPKPHESPINQVRVYHSTHYLLQPFHCIISCKQCIYVLTCLVSRTQRSFHSSVAKHLTTY